VRNRTLTTATTVTTRLKEAAANVVAALDKEVVAVAVAAIITTNRLR
jgi:hypothetical protein